MINYVASFCEVCLRFKKCKDPQVLKTQLGCVYIALSWLILICSLYLIFFDPLLPSTFKSDSNTISAFTFGEHLCIFLSTPCCSISFTDGIKLLPDRFNVYPLLTSAENDHCFAQQTSI